MEYVKVGTDRLLEEYFSDAYNSNMTLKPFGGLWCSIFYGENYNGWLDYLSCSKPGYLYNKYVSRKNPGKIKGVVITPSEDARILTLDSGDSFAELEKGYGFDFEKVGEDYDAIFYDSFKLSSAVPSRSYDIRRFISIPSFLALNPKVIKEYKKADITIDPADVDHINESDGILTTTVVLPDVYQMEPISDEYKAILDRICVQLKDEIFRLRLEYRNVPSYVIVEAIKKRIVELYGDDIMRYCQGKNYDADEVSYSLSTNTYKRTK